MRLRCLVAFVCSSFALGAQFPPQSTPEGVYERGQSYWNLSRGAFNELQKTAPHSPYALALIGEEKAQRRQYSPALAILNDAAARMPRLRGVHSALADVYSAMGQPAEAEAARTAEQKLGAPDCVVEKLECDFSAARFAEVVHAAKAERGPKSLYWLARAYRQLALASFAQFDNFPESAELHRSKAQLLREEHKYRESADEWRAAVKLSPNDAGLQRDLATALFLTEEYRTILPELQQLLKAQPESPNLNFFVGDSLLETEQNQAAVPYLESAVRLDPKLLPAHVSLGLCYVRLGDPQKAIPHLEAGLDLDRTGQLHYVLARAYAKTGQPERAKAMMEQYQQIQKASAGRPPAP